MCQEYPAIYCKYIDISEGLFFVFLKKFITLAFVLRIGSYFVGNIVFVLASNYMFSTFSIKFHFIPGH